MRPWVLQARFREDGRRGWGDWFRVESYGTEDRARAAQERFVGKRTGKRYETRVQAMTEEAFVLGYATSAGMTVDRLAERGLRVEPCDCGDVRCVGWRMGVIEGGHDGHDGG